MTSSWMQLYQKCYSRIRLVQNKLIYWMSNVPPIFCWMCVFALYNLNSTHSGRVTHICVSKLTIISSDNVLLPGQRQAIIWTNAGILLFIPSGMNISEILIKIHTYSFKKCIWKCHLGNKGHFVSLYMATSGNFEKNISNHVLFAIILMA